MLYKILIFILFVASSMITNAQKVVRINFVLEDIKVSEKELSRLGSELQHYFVDKVELVSERDSSASIRLTTKPSESQWMRSRYQLPPLPGFALFTPEQVTSETGVIAVLNRPYILFTESLAYPTDTRQAALNMLSRKRVDSILDYSANAALYQIDDRDIEFRIIREESPIYIEFNSITQLTKFEQEVVRSLEKAMFLLTVVEH